MKRYRRALGHLLHVCLVGAFVTTTSVAWAKTTPPAASRTSAAPPTVERMWQPGDGADRANDATAPVEPRTRQPGLVSLDVSGVPLDEVVRVVARQSGLILAGPSLPPTPITAQFRDLTADAALRAVFANTDWDGHVAGNRLVVVRADAVVMRSYRLRTARATDVVEALQGAVEGGSINADARTNTLVVRALVREHRQIEDLLPQLDRRQPQILIRTDIIEVDMDDDLSYGIDWHLFGSKAEGSITHEGELDGNWSPSISDFAFRYAHLGPSQVTATLRAVRGVTETRLLSSPRVVTVSGRAAEILVGERVPYAQSTTTTQTGATLQEIEFVDVGVKLVVTPFVDDEGVIHLKVHPEVSEVLDQFVQNVPRIGTREATTEVSLGSGETMVIGGLRKRVMRVSQRRLPWLGDLPGVGALFRSTSKIQGQAELIVFVTPVIMTDDYNKTFLDRGETFVEPMQDDLFGGDR